MKNIYMRLLRILLQGFSHEYTCYAYISNLPPIPTTNYNGW